MVKMASLGLINFVFAAFLAIWYLKIEIVEVMAKVPKSDKHEKVVTKHRDFSSIKNTPISIKVMDKKSAKFMIVMIDLMYLLIFNFKRVTIMQINELTKPKKQMI